MQNGIYTIFDKKLARYNGIFVRPNDFTAIRDISDEVVNQDSPYRKHPEDYALKKLGVIDIDTGVISPFSQPEVTIEVKEIVENKE